MKNAPSIKEGAKLDSTYRWAARGSGRDAAGLGAAGRPVGAFAAGRWRGWLATRDGVGAGRRLPIWRIKNCTRRMSDALIGLAGLALEGFAANRLGKSSCGDF